MSSPEETKQAADLIERLLTDSAFRSEFRRDPASACEQFGLTELAEELRGGSGAKALYTLELRQSMSSLAGVIMAAAAEGIGALELAGFGKAEDKRVAGVVNEALSRHSIKAISRAQMPAVDHDGHAAQGGGHAHAHGDGHGHGDAAVVDDIPADDASADAGCGSCGDPTGVCGHTAGDGCPSCGDPSGGCGHSAADCSTCGHHGSGCGHGVACGACGDSTGVCGHTPGKGCPSCGDASGGCGHAAAACGVCGDGAGSCGHSHADRKRAAGLVHEHSHAGHSHGQSGSGHAHAHGGQSHAGHADAAAQPAGQPAQPHAHAAPAAAPAPSEAPEGLHAAASAQAAPAAPAAPAEPQPSPAGPASGGRESGVFAGVAEAAKPSATPTIEAMPAVEEAAAPAPAAAAAPPAEPPAEAAPVAAAAAPIEIAVGDVPYPGDNAPKPQIAAWMASRAQAAGIPPELPVMAALVESRLSNINFGHADSIGFFQMRTSIWDQGEYAGYGQDPEKQIKWFIDHAVHEKNKRIEDGYTNFLTDDSKWGDWIADVERPAEEYRGRYQERLAEARALLSKPS